MWHMFITIQGYKHDVQGNKLQSILQSNLGAQKNLLTRNHPYKVPSEHHRQLVIATGRHRAE